MPDASDEIRYHLDEHIDPAIARALRRAGIVVSTAVENELLGASDPNHLDVAIAHQSVLVTDDTDFLQMTKDGAEHFGIVFCVRRLRTIGDILRELLSLYQTT